jgi:hypothetical protein
MSIGAFRARVLALTCASIAWGVPASAQSLSLAEVLGAVRSEPQLVGQIEVELRRRDLKVPEIVCSAAQHGNQWRLFGAARSAPYECRIGDRSLRIDAERTYFDAQGHKLEDIGRVPDNILLSRAKYFRERNFRWTRSP